MRSKTCQFIKMVLIYFYSFRNFNFKSIFHTQTNSFIIHVCRQVIHSVSKMNDLRIGMLSHIFSIPR